MTMPNHMAHPAIGAPESACSWKVSQRKAPGAIRAIALTVKPVRPSVGFIVGVAGVLELVGAGIGLWNRYGGGWGGGPRGLGRGGGIVWVFIWGLSSAFPPC